MTKRIAGVPVALFAVVILGPVASAESPVLPAAAVPSPVRVGVAGAVHGLVRISSGHAVGMLVESGRPIYLGDTVTTDGEGRLQVLLLDETVFTIGPNSSIVIDEFVYDPATNDGQITAQVLKGAFRFVTGKIAHKKPENMRITLPAGTIGVRGTMVAGRVDGQSSMVALLGPGPENNVGARVGRIEVSNPVDGHLASVLVTQPGFGTTIGGFNLPPTPPAPVPPHVMDALQHDLAAPAMPTKPEGDAAAKQNTSESSDDNRPKDGGPPGPHRPDGNQPASGEQQPGGPPGTNSAKTAGPPGPNGPANTMNAPQGTSGYMPPPTGTAGTYTGGYIPPMGTTDAFRQTATFGTFDPYAAAANTATTTATQAATTAAQTTSTTIQNGVAAREQLAQIQTGVFHYQGTGPFVQTLMNGTAVNKPGTMLVKVNIDFGNRTIGGGTSVVGANTIPGGGNIGITMPVIQQSFNNAGPAIFHQTSTAGTFNFDYAVQNVNNQLGTGMGVHGHYQSSDGLNVGDGVNNLPRQDGPAQ